MSDTTGLKTFDHVTRGDAAPAWVRDGVVASWGLPEAAEVTLIVLSENITFKATVDGSPVLVIRLGRPGYAESVAHVRSELVWVEALRDEIGVPTPAPVRGTDGDFVQHLTDVAGGVWTAVAFGFASGVILEDHEDFAHHFTEIGSLTARLHRHARAWREPSGFTRFAWRLDDMVSPSARWGHWGDADLSESEHTLLARAEVAARAMLDDAGVTESDPACFGLIHADLRPSNVMTDGSSLTIIDFDDCGYGFYLYDFGAALTFYEHRPEALEMAAGWLDGYNAVTPLTSTEVDAAAALSLLRRLTMLGWQTTHRADALPPDLWEENRPGTVEVAARFLDDPRWLVRG